MGRTKKGSKAAANKKAAAVSAPVEIEVEAHETNEVVGPETDNTSAANASIVEDAGPASPPPLTQPTKASEASDVQLDPQVEELGLKRGDASQRNANETAVVIRDAGKNGNGLGKETEENEVAPVLAKGKEKRGRKAKKVKADNTGGAASAVKVVEIEEPYLSMAAHDAEEETNAFHKGESEQENKETNAVVQHEEKKEELNAITQDEVKNEELNAVVQNEETSEALPSAIHSQDQHPEPPNMIKLTESEPERELMQEPVAPLSPPPQNQAPMPKPESPLLPLDEGPVHSRHRLAVMPTDEKLKDMDAMNDANDPRKRQQNGDGNTDRHRDRGEESVGERRAHSKEVALKKQPSSSTKRKSFEKRGDRDRKRSSKRHHGNRRSHSSSSREAISDDESRSSRSSSRSSYSSSSFSGSSYSDSTSSSYSRSSSDSRSGDSESSDSSHDRRKHHRSRSHSRKRASKEELLVGYRKRRRSLWDVRESPYGFPLPPPGFVLPSAAHRGGDGGDDATRIPSTTGGRSSSPPGGPAVPPPSAPPPHKSGYGYSDSATKTAAPAMSGGAPDPATRHARRCYVGNLPPDVKEQDIAQFFKHQLLMSNASSNPDYSMISVYLNHEKRFGFIELRTMPEAAAILKMDGLVFKGSSLRVRRPNDFNPSLVPHIELPPGFNLAALGIVSTQVEDGPNKMFIGGLPYHLTEDQIKELVQSYGPLKAFNLIKDSATGNSKGYGFFEYADSSVIDSAIQGFNGMRLGEKTLTVRRAQSGREPVMGAGGTFNMQNPLMTSPSNAPMAGAPVTTNPLVLEKDIALITRKPTRVLELRNMLKMDELEDDELYEEIVDDVKEECSKFGALKKVHIPRPNQGGSPIPGLGRVFLVYDNVDDCAKAFTALGSRKFDGRLIIATYLDEEKFERGEI